MTKNFIIVVLAITLTVAMVGLFLCSAELNKCSRECSEKISCPNNPETFNRYFLGCAAAQGSWAGSDPWSPDECVKYARKLAGCKETK
jgi:hypothetical protein